MHRTRVPTAKAVIGLGLYITISVNLPTIASELTNKLTEHA